MQNVSISFTHMWVMSDIVYIGCGSVTFFYVTMATHVTAHDLRAWIELI